MIYVDQLQHYTGKGRLNGWWCHMMTDQVDLAELHAMARRIGMKLSWFQDHWYHPQYDCRPSMREAAIAAGAVPLDALEMARRCSLLLNGKAVHRYRIDDSDGLLLCLNCAKDCAGIEKIELKPIRGAACAGCSVVVEKLVQETLL